MKSIEAIQGQVSADPAIVGVLEDLAANGDARLAGLTCSAKAMALAHFHRRTGRSLLAVMPTQEDAESLLGDLEICLGEERIFFFAETELIPYDERSPHVGLLGERIPALGALASGESVVVVTTARAISTRLPDPRTFRASRLPLAVGAEVDRDELCARLVAMGFRRERLVEEIGSFAVRGGLVDLYPFGSRQPLRVEFFGDEIESIRSFDPGTQRTIESIERADVLPQRELFLTPENLAAGARRGDLPIEEGGDPFPDGIEVFLPRIHPSPVGLLDWFDREGIVILDEPARLEERIDETMDAARSAFEELRSRGRDVPAPPELFLDAGEITRELAARPTVRLALFEGESAWASLVGDASGRDAGAALPSTVAPRRIRVTSQETFRGSFVSLRERLRAMVEDGKTVHVLCDNEGQRSRLEEMLDDLADSLHLAVAPLRNGFALPGQDLVVLTDHELFARSARRYRAFRHGGGAPIHDYSALKKGDYVVHVDHGVGRYDGILLLATGGIESECLRLRYKDGDSIYVPVDQINLVQKYIGGDAGEPPVVAKLGSTQWEKAKSRAKKAVEKMAGALLEIHAARAAREGHAFPPDGEWQREMEASFIYEETRDQRRATDAVKTDMMDSRPMDRLVCGDVGYGKTEVAIRAAFKAVSDDKQVAVLVPTTILAAQHLETFRERLRAYPVKVDMVSRFRSPKEQRETIARVKSGEVDILIGTHRILSKDIEFKDLGLVIVDEEQRFGVKHKERLKTMRRLVDVLTLTATPIPRTLNMALTGLREISVIDTPPPNKLPIETEVIESSDEVIVRAIRREVQRGGQVFFVHNRVQSIDSITARLRDLLPELRFDIGHGQMPERHLEKVMMDFLERRSDVLVSTMIIESGLDLPNVNTILIHRADTFGLAQLYQLRGRVGRSNHRAFAHLLIPEGVKLSSIARKRLRAIEEFSELGAGFRLAMRDMEIRGAGNFLGPEQSGHVHAIGYDLYCQMLREAIAELRGEEQPVERITAHLDVEIDAYLPEDYIEDPDQRIFFYKRLADLGEAAGLASLAEELRDRYGRLPEAARSLILLKELRLLAEAGGVERVRVRPTEAEFRFASGREPGPAIMKEMVHSVGGNLSFRADGREGLRVRLETGSTEETREGALALLRAAGASDTLSVSHAVQ